MSIGIVQQFRPTVHGTFSNSAAPTSAFTAGNLLEIACVTADTGTTGFTVAATGLTFTSCGSVVIQNGKCLQVFRAFNIPHTTPTVTVTATGATADPTAQGVLFVGTEYQGIIKTEPFVQQANGSKTGSASAATLNGTVPGNLITYSNIDSFDNCTVTTTSNGTVTPGLNTAFSTGFGRGGDWQSAPGASVTGTHGGPNGDNSIIAVEYTALVNAVGFDVFWYYTD